MVEGKTTFCIVKCQLGASNFPPKKLMLAWLKVSRLFALLTISWVHQISRQKTDACIIEGNTTFCIAHYQLGASNFPPKKLMLAWLKVRRLFVLLTIS